MKFFIILILIIPLFIFANPQFGNRTDVGLVEYDDISEASGIVASRKNANVIWTHNDSGDENVIYALNSFTDDEEPYGGDHLGVYTVDGITNRDWEDMAIGPAPGENEYYIYLADIGDSGDSLQYEYKYIYRFLEPDVSASQEPVNETITGAETITFVYPDGILYDAETLMVDPLTGDLYVVTKRHFGGSADIVFRAEYPQSTTEIITLEEIAQIEVPLYLDQGATGGEISPSGLEILIKTYSDVYYWSRKLEDDLWEAFDNEQLVAPYIPEPQGEAICWRSDGMGYFTISEEPEGLPNPAHLYFYPRIDNFITLNQLPTSLYKINENFTVTWSPSDMYCELYYSTEFAGEDVDNYTPADLNGIGSITTTPNDIGLSIGVYYCILYNPEFSYTSLVFTLIVESSQAVIMVSPSGSVNIPTPIFSWEPNPGVPYYFLVLSDHQFNIEFDEDDEPTITGIQPIWQIITPNTSALYGSLDPSGFFENTIPPLIPNHEYYWIVANNYGNDPLYTSQVVPGNPTGFVYDSDQSIESPVLIYPTNGDSLQAEETITFDWNDVDVAMSYHLFLFEIKYVGGNEGYYPIYDQATTNDSLVFPALSILLDAEYAWKVFATDENDVSSVSEDFRFYYDTTIGTLHLSLRNIDGSPVSYANVEIQPIDGSQDVVPLNIDEDGNDTKILVPGNYNLHCSKEGYETRDTLITIYEDLFPDSPEGDTNILVIMDYSPSYFYGNVVDTLGYLVDNVIITAEDENNEIRTITSSTGNYVIGVTPGLWTVSASKEEYSLFETVQSNIIEGQNIELPDLILLHNEKDLMGYVKNTLGIPISRANVAVTNGEITNTRTTNSEGYFKFSGLGFDTWTVSATKFGYSAPEPVEIEISDASPDIIVMDDIILTPNANIIIGNANNGLVGIRNVRITAVPEIGFATETLTNIYGNYTLNLSSGSYEITSYLENYVTQDVYNLNLGVGQTFTNIDFVFAPEEIKIFGLVTNPHSYPLRRTIVTAAFADTLTQETFIDTTGEDGSYSIDLDELGHYSVVASKENYFDSDPEIIDLTFANTTMEQNFILEHIPLFGSIHGKVVIYDESLEQSVPLDQVNLLLRNQFGEEFELNLVTPDSLFEFNDLLIPEEFSLEVTAQYLDQEYYDYIPLIEILEEEIIYRDFEFIYVENAVSLSGNVLIFDNESIPLENSKITVFDSAMAPIDTTFTNVNGYFLFNNLTEDTYNITIEADYDNEQFYGEITGILWTGENIVLEDYVFTFFLCSLDFFITEDGTNPIENVTVTISSNFIEDIIMVTNSNGYCSAANILHTGSYDIEIFKQQGSLGRIIPPESYEISLDSLGYYVQEKQLPLQFDLSQISQSLPYSEQIDLNLDKATSYNSPAFIYYFDVENNYFEEEMINSGTSYYVTIPAQTGSGNIDFWFSSYSAEQQLNYSNEENPFILDIFSEGIPDSIFSNITPNQPVLVYTQEMIFEVNVFDDSGQNIDDIIDESGFVEWIVDPVIGTIEVVAGEKRKVLFKATENISGSIEGFITADVTLENMTIELFELIKVRDMYLYNLVIISDAEEVDNEESISFGVIAYSDSGFAMTIPVEFEQVEQLIGELSQDENTIIYEPNSSFIGKFDIIVRANDPRTNEQISASKTLTVYKKINQETIIDTLFTGEGCNLIVYENMLDSLELQQPKIYLSSISSPPFKQFGVSNEISGKAFSLNSNKVQEIFNILPGLAFETEDLFSLENIYIAFWDNNALEWKSVGSPVLDTSPVDIILAQVPYISADYGLVTDSAPLGFYDLKLRPNPFTPYDQIGMNTGLQIEFRLSSNKTRYPKITAKIYTIDGTLVRTITKNNPMLKGDYQAGELETLYWDGRTDENRIARNGRYLIQLIAEDTKSRSEILKTIVLIK